MGKRRSKRSYPVRRQKKKRVARAARPKKVSAMERLGQCEIEIADLKERCLALEEFALKFQNAGVEQVLAGLVSTGKLSVSGPAPTQDFPLTATDKKAEAVAQEHAKDKQSELQPEQRLSSSFGHNDNKTGMS